MLELTLATTYETGTNVKGTVPGANWIFLLPSLDLGRVVCVGPPAPSALRMVSRFARGVAVICENEQERKILSEEPLYRDNGKVDLISLDRWDGLGHADSTVDVVWIANKGGLKYFSRIAGLLAELQRVLVPGGVIYLDPGSSFGGASGQDELASRLGAPQRLWLTPFAGEMQTAVPVQDEETIDHFLKERLYSQSMGYGAVKILKRISGGKRAARHATADSEPRAPTNGKQSRSPLRSMLRVSGHAVMRSLQSAERFLVEHSPSLRRYGAFFAGDNTELTTRPPMYLRSMAGEAGFDIDDYRWGLSARGAYNTRKVLIFLYSPDRNAVGERSPDLVVKIVREASLNYRLENEFRALRQLSESDLAERGIAPQAAFFGLHCGLAVVGETMIKGRPFLQRTRATAECNYARSAVDWIINLGAGTADSTLATPEDVAGVMETLFGYFSDIYRLSAGEHEFLARQIAAIGGSGDAFPLVFQHGDPGTWNAVIAPEGHVTFLDWEAAEPEGMPLWDLFYFQRSYCMVNARKDGIHNRRVGISRGFLEETPFNRQLVESTRRYCEKIGLATTLVEPLFFTCWMHRALKEAASLSPATLDNGHYLNLLRHFIENRHSEALGRLFSSGAASAASGHSISLNERVALT
jgi:SAM-dependent methyltransferase